MWLAELGISVTVWVALAWIWRSRSGIKAATRELRQERGRVEAHARELRQLTDAIVWGNPRVVFGIATHLHDDIAAIRAALVKLRAAHASHPGSGPMEFLDELGRAVDQAERQGGQFTRAAALHAGAGGDPLAVRPLTDMAMLVDHAASRVHRGRPVVVSTGEPLPVRILPEVLLEVLRYLLDHAATHAPAATAIHVETSRVGKLALLTVEDHGSTVPAELWPSLFHPFAHVRSSDSPASLGLDLFMAQQLARRHGGDLVCVTPQQTPGVRLELRLPITYSQHVDA